MPTVATVGAAKAAFYSVKDAVTIAGSRRLPSICYPILETERKTIEALQQSGKAVTYTERVRFVSGRPVSAAKLSERAQKKKGTVSQEVAPVVIEAKVEKKGKKGRHTESESPSVAVAEPEAASEEFSEKSIPLEFGEDE